MLKIACFSSAFNLSVLEGLSFGKEEFGFVDLHGHMYHSEFSQVLQKGVEVVPPGKEFVR